MEGGVVPGVAVSITGSLLEMQIMESTPDRLIRGQGVGEKGGNRQALDWISGLACFILALHLELKAVAKLPEPE